LFELCLYGARQTFKLTGLRCNTTKQETQKVLLKP
jgi:hypothetical protein